MGTLAGLMPLDQINCKATHNACVGHYTRHESDWEVIDVMHVCSGHPKWCKMVLPKPLKAKRGAQDSLDSLTPLLSQVPPPLLAMLTHMLVTPLPFACELCSQGMSLQTAKLCISCGRTGLHV